MAFTCYNVHKSKKKVENLKNINETKGKKRERDSDDNFEIPVSLMNSKSHAPETPKEYQRRQNKIRRETDPLTGRSRLIRGSEIIEGIVSKQRQAIIKKEATEADGNYFQESISCQLKK
uniref:ADP-ribosylation factor-like protein 6-interacting protein 4 n=1 Tax=Glossina brevipalpis TaxID=37001 RepID=A0A1A9X1C7_9MUSC